LVEEILKETYGTVIYQEQLMQMAVLLADFTWSEADKLRKVIGKKRDAKEFDPFKDKFVNNAYITKEAAEKIWTEFELAALYMFNKSHAVAYSMMSYQTMWLKVHYPAEFIWALLYNEDAQDKVTSYLMEAQRIGIEILPPDVNESQDLFTIDSNSIRFGIKNISGCGEGAIDEIIRNRPYRSFDEFNNKCSRKFVNSRIRENLEKVGAFKSTGHISQYDHEKYYLPILGFALSTNTTSNDIDEMTQTLEGFDENNSSPRFVKVIIRSTKKTPKYLRVEMEDESGSATIFSDRNAEIANRDFIYALIGDRTMHMHCDVYSYEESEVEKFVSIVKSGMDNEWSWLYDHGLGTSSNDKSLIYVFSERNFVTSAGKTMGSMYAWDGQSFIKISIFPALYAKIMRFWNGPGWYASKLDPLKRQSEKCEFKSFTFANDNSLLDVEAYIERRKLSVHRVDA
jgi:DNA polymerase III alpha subunit